LAESIAKSTHYSFYYSVATQTFCSNNKNQRSRIRMEARNYITRVSRILTYSVSVYVANNRCVHAAATRFCT